MKKRAMAITLVVALVLAQSGLAHAFISDDVVGPFTATATVGGQTQSTLTVQIRDVVGGAIAAQLGWQGITTNSEWEVSDQYLEVTYQANQVGWGVQIFTDNLGVGANPVYGGDPTTDPASQPAGLIGTQDNTITCPLVTLVTKDAILESQIQDPVLVIDQQTDARYFTSGYDEIPGGDSEKVWFWLKDVSGTEWVDGNQNGQIDAGEIQDTFNKDQQGGRLDDDYATIVNSFGSSTGWVNTQTDTMFRDNAAASPIAVYLAADFTNANVLQEYKTNTIQLEIYHE